MIIKKSDNKKYVSSALIFLLATMVLSTGITIIPQANAQEAIFFADEFDGTLIDSSMWSTETGTNPPRWCDDSTGGGSGPGNWFDPSSQPCKGVTAQPPYGAISVSGGEATFGAGSSRAFPYIWMGQPSQSSPIPDNGDFIIEIRMKYDSIASHGNGLYLRDWANSEPVGDNAPVDSSTQLRIWADRGGSGGQQQLLASAGGTTIPLGNELAYHTYRLEYAGGQYSLYVDDTLKIGPVSSNDRPNALWIGNPIFTWWGVTDWSDFRIDYIRVSAPSSLPPDDVTSPVLSLPSDLTAEATGPDGTAIEFEVSAQDDIDGTATLMTDGTSVEQDEVGGDIEIICTPASGSTFPIGDTTVDCSATDAAGNTGRASFMVTIIPQPDRTAPVITVPEDITQEATGPNGAEVSFEVSAEDDVDGTMDVTCDQNSGDTFVIGETVVTCTAEDAAGNSAQESFTIEVVDTTSPEVGISADNKKGQSIQNNGNTESKEVRVAFQTTDVVDSSPDTECSLNGGAFSPCTSPVSYNKLVKGNYEFVLRATDDARNTSVETFRWIVK